MPNNLWANSGLVVLQNGLPLAQDELRENCWRLERTSGEVVVQWNEEEVAREIVLGEKDFLPFKLAGPNKSHGRCVKSPSSGWYLVVAPGSWERDNSSSGLLPVAPEPVALTGYQAHLFLREKGGSTKIAFRTPAGEPVVIEPKALPFELVGKRLNVIEDMGPLFSEGPPRIRALQAQGWKNVKTIVVGEEGMGKGKWRWPFSPVRELIEQDLPDEISDRRSGWYFIRFYDTNDDLIESLDFRFISALIDIKISQPPPLPFEGGHQPVCVEFLHEPGCAVQSADDLTNIRIERRDDKTILTIPPDPAYDETHWLVSPEGGPQVEVSILVERVWWTVGEEDKEPVEWTDQPLILTREDFAATSKKALWLRFPRKRWVGKVYAGVEQDRARFYTIKALEKMIPISLREFGDNKELRNVGVSPIYVWIHLKGRTYSKALCKLIVEAICNLCNFSTLVEDDILSHINERHLDDFFKPLTYDEMRNLISSLTEQIYQCCYCPLYIKSNDHKDPTTAIISHIEHDCQEARRDKPVQIRFRIVENPDEIRERVIKECLSIYRCVIRGCYLEGKNQHDRMQHLIDNHRNTLYKLR